jgi:hypothetical protein
MPGPNPTNPNPSPNPDLTPITRLSRDLKEAAATLSPDEARYLVDAYYQIQEYRKAANNQVRSLVEAQEPHTVIAWLAEQNESLESQIKRALDRLSDSSPVGVWAKSITGIGPVISAGLLAYIDIEKAPTVGHIWRFAGLDPTMTWEKGQKRPWNASLKTLCWKIGESFVKVSNNAKDVYGHVYTERKGLEDGRNAESRFADQAKAKLEKFKIGKATDAYKAYSEGKLPPAHIHARAKRYAVKLFLAHYHHVAFVERYGKEPPKPYIIEHGGHTHYIAPPGYPVKP